MTDTTDHHPEDDGGPVGIWPDTDEEDTRDVWQLLEDAPKAVGNTADLYYWSTNYDAGKGPFTLFLDLIGWSDEDMGEAMYDLNKVPEQLGYVELGKLADALIEYADSPTLVRSFVDELMEAEGRE